jgi:predicted HTH transcriptional regulator
LLKAGEDQTREFKKSLNLMKEAFTTLCGMANAETAQGNIVFGVDPAGAIVGLGETNLDTAQRTLALHARQKFDPPLAVEIQAHMCEDQSVLVVYAQRHRAVPFHEYDGRAYIREGSTTRQLSMAEKQQLTRARSRDMHNGPWRCDRCGAFAGMVSSVEVTAAGPRKTYRHGCGGEWWPAT